LLSAGIGVTPVLAMLHVLARESSQREISWLYAARNSAEHPFAPEVRALLANLPASRSHVWYSRPGNGDVAGRDFDSAGHVDIARFSEIGVKPNGRFYLCGPPSFLNDMRAGLIAWGVPTDRIYSEAFGSGPSVTPGVINGKPMKPPHAPLGATGDGPNISFARSGVVARWSRSYGSLLEFAEACDVPVRWSCRTGVCHTCESGLISGDVDYSPEPLDPPARGDVLLCCSTPRDDVILDL
jgi:ferredoxin-NADP reductase